MRKRDSPLPRPAATLLRALLPDAERDEVLLDLEAEYRERVESGGGLTARAWVWGQVLASVPPLVRGGWWRGWSGFEPRANRLRPGGTMIEEWTRDLKFALRRLRRRPLYAALTVLTLALGVAGTAAVYGVAKRLLLERLPYAAEEQIVMFWSPGDWRESEFLYLRPQIEGFTSVAAIRPGDVTLEMDGAPARLLRGMSASAELFEVLGTSPRLGPGFRAGDDQLGAEPVAVISHSLWREIGASPSIIGQTLRMGGIPRTIVGVMPEGFWFPDPTVQVWLVEEMDPQNHVGNYALIARMRPGGTIENMAPHLRRITDLLGEAYRYPAEWDKTRNAALTPIREQLVGSVRPGLIAMLVAMAVILLIACVNVAALMLGQVDSRASELAVRSALGAGRKRLLRQVVVEAIAIGALAGVVGALLAVVGFRLLVGSLPLGALAEAARIDWSLFAAAMLIALLAATTIALVPGASIAGGNPQDRLSRTRTSGVVGRGGRVESVLVVAQIALVLLMASGAALLIRSVGNLRSINLGMAPERLAVIDLVIPSGIEIPSRPPIIGDMVTEVAALPGVRSAAASQRIPLRGSGHNWGITVEGSPELEITTVATRIVTPDYFETMGIEVRAGRTLLETDRNPDAEGVVVINQALAERYFADRDPLGQRIAFTSGRWETIVGVVENVAETDLTAGPQPARYMIYDQVPFILEGQTIVVRVQDGQSPAAVLDMARRAIQSTAPGVAIRELTTMQNVVDRAMGPTRQVMTLLTLLSGLALALGIVGVYGVVSHFVARRRRDWGIRLALGMTPVTVMRRILLAGGSLIGKGILAGSIAFVLLSRLLASFLYGVEPWDPYSLLGAAAVLAGSGVLAALLPAWRASRIDPALVLREQ
jgi:putative ABC transport system permease protein